MLFGHEDKVSAFQRMAREGTLGHAYLFYGERGVGKRTFAEHLANFLERGAFEGMNVAFTDAQFFSPDEKGTFGIDTVRAIQRFLFQSPLVGLRRVAVLDDAERLTPEAQSAVLKIVEEPPRRALIICIVFDPRAIFPPLRSRFQKVYFARFKTPELAQILARHFKLSEKRANEIAEDSFGRLGYALCLAGIVAQGENEEEEGIETYVGKRIIELWRDGVEKNYRAISSLLKKETEVKRFNVNQRLQRKAVDVLAHP